MLERRRRGNYKLSRIRRDNGKLTQQTTEEGRTLSRKPRRHSWNFCRQRIWKRSRYSELCRKAGIHRTTFHASYDGLHCIADSIKRKLEDSVKDFYRQESHDFTQFLHVKDYQDVYRTYFKLGYDDRYGIVDYDREIASRCFGDRFFRCHIEFFKAGLTR